MLLFLLMMYGQVFAACNISFTAAAGGQVTFEAANSQYAGQPARYKYSFSAADSTNCGNADVFGLSNADGSSNSNNTGVTTRRGSCFNPAQRVEQYVCSLDKQWWPQRFQRFLLFHSRWLIEYH
jgi:hypothetical protein